MPLTLERVQRLREFGLSEYQARAYLALLELGSTEAREVSRLAKVPLAKVYHTLQQLQERGLAVIYPESPRRYAPVPFDEYLTRMRAEHEAQISLLEDARRDLAQDFRITGDQRADDRGKLMVLRGRGSVVEALGHVGRGATRSLVVLASRGLSGSKGARLLRGLVEQACARGVDARLLLQGPADPLDAAEDVAGARVRRRETEDALANVAVLVADGEEAILVHFLPDDGDLRRGNDVAARVQQSALAAALQTLLECEWRLAGGELVEGRAASSRPDSSAWTLWTGALRKGGPGGALGLMADAALIDLLADEATPAGERRLFAAALRHRLRAEGRGGAREPAPAEDERGALPPVLDDDPLTWAHPEGRRAREHAARGSAAQPERAPARLPVEARPGGAP